MPARPLVLALALVACGTEGDPTPAGPTSADTALYRNVTQTHLPAAPGQFTMDVAVGDLDGDGDLDLLLAVEFGQNRLLLNDGAGVFRDATTGRVPVASHDSEDIALEDFDGDGDLDAVIVSEDDRTNELYVNDGSARFSAGTLPVAGISNAVVAGDVDGDGDPDLVIGNAGAEALLLNVDGTWIDASAQLPAAARGVTQDVELGDVDGDGDLDILVANEDGNRLLLNDGSGTFTDGTEQWIPSRAAAEETREGDLADVDGDGDLDVFFANTRSSNGSADPANRLLRNDGDAFTDVTASALPPNSERSFDGEFWDVDDDGDVDIVTGQLEVAGNQAVPTPYRVWVNDGTGVFSAAPDLIFPRGAVAFGFDSERADVDGDGRADFILASRGSQDLLLLRR